MFFLQTTSAFSEGLQSTVDLSADSVRRFDMQTTRPATAWPFINAPVYSGGNKAANPNSPPERNALKKPQRQVDIKVNQNNNDAPISKTTNTVVNAKMAEKHTCLCMHL